MLGQGLKIYFVMILNFPTDLIVGILLEWSILREIMWCKFWPTRMRRCLHWLICQNNHLCGKTPIYYILESLYTIYLEFKCTLNSRCSIFNCKFFCVLCSVTDLTSTWLGTLSIVVSLGIITHSAFHQGYDQVYASLIKYKPSAKVIKKPRTKLSPV